TELHRLRVGIVAVGFDFARRGPLVDRPGWTPPPPRPPWRGGSRARHPLALRAVRCNSSQASIGRSASRDQASKASASLTEPPTSVLSPHHSSSLPPSSAMAGVARQSVSAYPHPRHRSKRRGTPKNTRQSAAPGGHTTALHAAPPTWCSPVGYGWPEISRVE